MSHATERCITPESQPTKPAAARSRKARSRAPTGGAVIFSCSLLHEATAVTKGRRYAFLPFFYDDAAAKIREANAASIVFKQAQGAPVEA